jgi:hypothetical protein
MREELGRVVRKGRIRVDARKAMAKLREHLLVDLHLYAVEVARAAVLAGATRIDVEFDADDVILSFDGEAPEADALPRLFEHLIGEADGDGARHLRLLALAVNAALGLDPAWVEVASWKDGRAAKVTWTPALVAAIEREEKALPEPEAIAPPGGTDAGTRFHLRRKLGWETVRRAAAKTAPREVALLTEAACSLRAKLTVNGAAPPPPAGRPAAIARAAIALPGVRSAHVEILRATDVAPHVDFCELGLLLARSSFAFGGHFPMAAHAGVAPPVRIVIDADALPTNASRSAVREDAPLLGALPHTAAPALSDAIAAVAAALFEKGAAPDGVAVDARDRAALEDALGAFLCAAEASLAGRVKLPEALASLLSLPLFRDGLGRPLSHGDIPREGALLVWSGDEPVPDEMAPWAQHIVWRRGRVAERILAARETFDPEKLAALAKRGAARRRKLLAAPPGEAAVPDGDYLARERFAFGEGPFAGLSGEVAIAADPAAYVRNLGLRVFLEGRFFEAFPVPEAAVPAPCVIALSWPGHVVPKLAYEGVEPTAGLRAALAFAVRQAVLACERFAASPEGAARAREPRTAAVLRAALATAAIAPVKMASAQGFEMPALAELLALLEAPVWPTAGGGATSLGALSVYAGKTGGICVAAPGTPGRAADGRPVVCLSSVELSWLSACLKPTVALVRYDGALIGRGGSPRERARAALVELANGAALLASAPILHVEGKSCAFVVTLGAAGTRVWHAGAEVARGTLDDSFGGVTIGLDDDSIVPAADWKSVLFTEDRGIPTQAERAFASTLAAALMGDARSRSELAASLGPVARSYPWPEVPSKAEPAVLRYLVDRAARGRATNAPEEERDLAARIEAIPFLAMIAADGEPRTVSLADVARVYGAAEKIPFLRQPPRFRPARWRPLVVASDALVQALSRWSDGRLYDASYLLLEQEKLARLEDRLTELRAQPPLDPKVVGDRGDTGSTTVYLAAIPRHGVYGVAAALPKGEYEAGYACAEVLYEDRLVCEVPLLDLHAPLIARVSVLEREAFDGFDRLSDYGRGGVAARVEAAAAELALRILEAARQPGASRVFFRDERALRLVLAVASQEQRDGRLDNALRHPELPWPTVQGDERPWTELCFVGGAVWAGAVAHASWLPPDGPPTELDRPILLLEESPHGKLLAAILRGLTLDVRPVTDAIEKLQAMRARGSQERPKLAQRPVHPKLAVDLHLLEAKGVEGEVGIYESGDAIAEVTSLDGDTRRIPLEVGFPARAVGRVAVLAPDAVPELARQLTLAARKLLLGLIASLGELPPFVRAHLRSVACRGVSKDTPMPRSLKEAPIFPEVDGKWWSLADVLAGKPGELSCTFDPPPYAAARQDGTTLQLTPTEHLQLSRKLKVLNVTEWMRRDLEAERRRSAPQAEHVRAGEQARSHFLSSFEVADGSTTGEIGVLEPLAAGARGIQVLVTRRPVCRLDDGPGWPIAAVVNDDGLHPTRWFDGVLPTDEIALRARMRALATRHLATKLAAEVPPEAQVLARAFVDEAVPPAPPYGSTEPMSMLGYVYLPATWPAQPTVRILVQGLGTHEAEPLALAAAPIQPWLPIGAHLLVSHAAQEFTRGAACRLALALRGVAERLLAKPLREAPADPEVAAYAWNLRLLGSTANGEPEALAADGSKVDADAVIAALAGPGEIWLTDRQGVPEGLFPEGVVPFVLVDDRSPLVRVLRARVPPGKLKVLGALAPPAPAAPRPESALAPPSSREPEALAEKFDADDASNRASRSWLGAVLGRVAGLFSDARPEGSEPTGVGDAVERMLRAMRLRDEPVTAVHEVARGKLVRYDRQRRAIFLNVEHPALAPHFAAPSPAPLRRACVALAAAALSEVNIALENVTDQDEAQALLELLRQEGAHDEKGSEAG